MRDMLADFKDVEVCESVATIRGALKDTDIPVLEALADEILK